MLDWKGYKTKLTKRLGIFARLSPDTMKGYQTLSQANADGVLDTKTRELIALACAVTTRCDGCIDVHTQAAIQAGCSEEEIAAALGVAVAMNAGAAMVYSARVMDAYAQLKPSDQTEV
ncbi:carboxymuconolactone decarboxylase family protein [Basilea psittacipulmonis]|uniref:Alkylhydroperoxidase n=1 Tax=Basilea psittacipulmonis DSM 24701 TaxID=1072685 RepID=A0A077DG21_9BURK|nr:carboxymuconolactone decarboxylase family protein [Basilea psittacipulmonis]AIL32392.1 alkylhydroperoxidase [Basilea psittacipulmonis DSM 24701]